MYEREPEMKDFCDYSDQIGLLRQKLMMTTYPGYPEFDDRYHGLEWQYEPIDSEGRMILQDGPWTVNSHPNRVESDAAPSPDEQQRFIDMGLELDSMGRPLHPWVQSMISAPLVGIVTGKGAYREWGPNYTADSIILRGEDVLLIKRSDTGDWALPGGFIDEGESPADAARREVQEETGIELPEGFFGGLVYEGPVIDVRVTANAWPETSAFLHILPHDIELPEPIGADDALRVEWVPLRIVLEGGLFGAHRFLVQRALEVMETNAS